MLGMYLGDGHIAVGRRGVQALTISCDDNWPGVKRTVTESLGLLMGTAVCHVQAPGCTVVKAYSKHWCCLFPQHGEGRKHDRPIVLEPWQQEIVDNRPGPFLQGLFHSDGCRTTNRTRAVVNGVEKAYAYPRWMFSNKSEDIHRLCEAALDRLGIAYRRSRADTVSVSRRDAVELMDRLIGPKT